MFKTFNIQLSIIQQLELMAGCFFLLVTAKGIYGNPDSTRIIDRWSGVLKASLRIS